MFAKRQTRRRVRFQRLEERKVLDAGGLCLDADSVLDVESTAMGEQAEIGSLAPAETTIVAPPRAAALVAASEQTSGTLTLDSVILGGIQNDLVLSLGEFVLTNTELSGMIEIGEATSSGDQITGFSIVGGLINATDTTGLLELMDITAVPLDINPGINPVSNGSFEASEVGVSINNGTAEITGLGLSFDFSADPISGPGTGTGSIVVNSVSGRDYDITVSIPISLELEAAPGIIASVEGNIVASGVVTIAPTADELISEFYNQVKQSIGSDALFGDLITATKAAVDSGDVGQREQVYVDAQQLTADLSMSAIGTYDDIAAGISDPEELDYLYYAITVVVSEFEALRDFLGSTLQNPSDFELLTDAEFFDAAVLYVQERVFNF